MARGQNIELEHGRRRESHAQMLPQGDHQHAAGEPKTREIGLRQAMRGGIEGGMAGGAH